MLQDLIGHPEYDDFASKRFDRIQALNPELAAARERLPQLCDLAIAGLQRMALPAPELQFPHTMRSVGNRNGSGVTPEGTNLRYTINVAQGLAWVSEAEQRAILGGKTAADLALSCIKLAADSREPGAIALAAWAAAEIAGVFAADLFKLLETSLRTDKTIQTVSCAWALTAALAARHLGPAGEVQRRASRMLMQHAQADSGLFRHISPAGAAGLARGHVGCFADQVYPIQALARLGFMDGDSAAMRAAEACAARIVALQGEAGQWWWHYDTRDGTVVEGYPVYSVHQHAMAPMALLDLYDAGGTDHRAALAKGLGWLDQRPETNEPMISVQDGVIWRKIGRAEPPKLVRSVAAVTTAVSTGWHLPGLNTVFPAAKVDRECRPYEFGWMLYAWRSRGVVQGLAK